LGVLLLAIEDGRLTVAAGNELLQNMVSRSHYRTPTMDLSSLFSRL
jgi:hypothetical protein